MKSKNLSIISTYLLVLTTYLIVFIDEPHILRLCKEDGPIESVGAIFFVIASLIFFVAYGVSSGSGNAPRRFRTKRNIFYLFLGIVLLICFGEEISWGQRLFSWETPRLLGELNAQGETNIHNLWLFHERRPDGTQKSVLAMTLNMWKLFCFFWLAFCVAIPLADRVSLRARMLFRSIGVPITPLWIGGLFFTHAVFFHIIYNFVAELPYSVLGRINELKESNYAFIFVVLACQQLKETVQSRSVSAN